MMKIKKMISKMLSKNKKNKKTKIKILDLLLNENFFNKII